MKKIAKLSLVTAVMVAGLTNVNAASLEEAIKNVDISGSVRYRMEEKSTSTEDQDVNIDVKIKVPVTDNVTFIANANWDDDNQETQTSHTATTSATNGSATDTSAKLDQYYFQYTNGALTAYLGTQNIPGRLTDAEQGSGLVALYNLGDFTVGAASMYNNDITSEMLNSVIALGSVGPVSLLAQYVDVDDVAKVYNLKADVKVDVITAGLEYSDKELETGATTDDDRSTFKAYVSAKAGIVSGKLSYAKTGDNGSGSIDEAAETASELLLWQLGTAGNKDMDVVVLDASVAVTDKISLRAAYADGEVGSVDHEEILGQVSYKVAKNLNTYIRYSEYEVGTADSVDRARLEVKYTF